MTYTRIKRAPRCSFCYNQGHTRNNCPTAKQQAANGDSYAQKVVERAAVKKCSYCNDSTHTKATCDKLYTDERSRAEKHWVGILGIIECIKELKLAEGAFVYGPMTYYHTSMPSREEDYELINYSVSNVKVRQERTDQEAVAVFSCETLAEPSQEGVRSFRNYVSAPGLYEAVATLKTEYEQGQMAWLRNNDAGGYDRVLDGRRNLKELTTVLVPATDEAVNAAVNKLLTGKPEILKHPDRKSYQKAERAAKKAEKNKGE